MLMLLQLGDCVHFSIVDSLFPAIDTVVGRDGAREEEDVCCLPALSNGSSGEEDDDGIHCGNRFAQLRNVFGYQVYNSAGRIAFVWCRYTSPIQW